MEGHARSEDDAGIPDAEELYRSVHRTMWEQAPGRATSVMFGDTKQWEASVDRGSICTPEETKVRLPERVGVLAVTAGSARATAHVAGVKATPTDGNPAHADILRESGTTDRGWYAATRLLANAAEWAIKPPD